jgi:hypothetical protein
MHQDKNKVSWQTDIHMSVVKSVLCVPRNRICFSRQTGIHPLEHCCHVIPKILLQLSQLRFFAQFVENRRRGEDFWHGLINGKNICMFVFSGNFSKSCLRLRNLAISYVTKWRNTVLPSVIICLEKFLNVQF